MGMSIQIRRKGTGEITAIRWHQSEAKNGELSKWGTYFRILDALADDQHKREWMGKKHAFFHSEDGWTTVQVAEAHAD